MYIIYYGGGAAAAAKLLQSCPTLCDSREGNPPGFPVPGILQARTLEWVAISFSNYGCALVAKSCTTLGIGCSQPGSSVYGISQTRILIYSTMYAVC